MAFNIEAYANFKGRMIEALEIQFKNESILLDGVICPSVFAKQPIRILCVLAEPYGYQDEDLGSRPDVEAMLNSEGVTANNDVLGLRSPSVKAPKVLATLLLLIQQSLAQREEVVLKDWQDEEIWPCLLRKDVEYERKLQALSKVAWLNLKKVCAPRAPLDSGVMRNHARANRKLLTEQIQFIDPHFSLTCGSDATAMAIELGLFGRGVAIGKPELLQVTETGRHIMEIYHPSARGPWSYTGIYNCYIKIYHQLKGAGY